MKCFDDQTNIWWPAHEWRDGTCGRCGAKLPGVTDDARAEMLAERAQSLAKIGEAS